MRRSRCRWPRAGTLVRADDRLLDLLLAGDPALAADLARRALAPLDQLPAGSRQRLRETLAAWLDAQGHARTAAESLHVHVQTLRYRLGRLHDVFGDSLDDPSRRLEPRWHCVSKLSSGPHRGRGTYPMRRARRLHTFASVVVEMTHMTESTADTGLPLVLECRGLRKRFGELEAVRGVSFQIAEGETYGLLGPNGAGKTTTISMVCGLLEPDAGEVVVAGRPLTTRSVGAKAAIGYVPQELAIYPDLNARENLRFFARLYGLASARPARASTRCWQVIGLSDRAREQTKNFSGGMQRRLNIGIGLLHRPRLLVLDEPTVGVDPQSRNAILESVEQLSARAWPSSTRPTTWRRPSASATGSGSSTSVS